MSKELSEGWVAYWDYDCGDATGLHRTPEAAIEEWEGGWGLERFRDLCEICDELDQDDCGHFPAELRVGRVVYPDPLVTASGNPSPTIKSGVAILLGNLADDAEPPEGVDDWPPDDSGPHLEQLHQDLIVSLRRYLKATTGRSWATWWEVESEKIWKRSEDGSWGRSS